MLKPLNYVFHYTGHRCRTPDDIRWKNLQPERLAQEVTNLIKRYRVVELYGSLAAGSDIVFAECAMKLGCKLNLFIPISLDFFLEQSVYPAGEEWIRRFKQITSESKPNIIQIESLDNVFSLATDYILNQVVEHAEQAGLIKAQLSIWDKIVSNNQIEGTYADIKKAQKLGFEIVNI